MSSYGSSLPRWTKSPFILCGDRRFPVSPSPLPIPGKRNREQILGKPPWWTGASTVGGAALPLQVPLRVGPLSYTLEEPPTLR